MSKKKKNWVPFDYYERSDENNNGYESSYIRLTFVQIVCMDELKDSSFRLYCKMKLYARGESSFTFPYSLYKNFLSKQGFIQARQELVDKGYLKPFLSTRNNKKPITYTFSGEWRNRNQERISELTKK